MRHASPASTNSVRSAVASTAEGIGGGVTPIRRCRSRPSPLKKRNLAPAALIFIDPCSCRPASVLAPSFLRRAPPAVRLAVNQVDLVLRLVPASWHERSRFNLAISRYSELLDGRRTSSSPPTRLGSTFGRRGVDEGTGATAPAWDLLPRPSYQDQDKLCAAPCIRRARVVS